MTHNGHRFYDKTLIRDCYVDGKGVEIHSDWYGWREVSKQITVAHYILYTILYHAHVSHYASSDQNRKKNYNK